MRGTIRKFHLDPVAYTESRNVHGILRDHHLALGGHGAALNGSEPADASREVRYANQCEIFRVIWPALRAHGDEAPPLDLPDPGYLLDDVHELLIEGVSADDDVRWVDGG